MPNVVPNATASVTMAWSLAKEFTRIKELAALETVYANGESHRSLLVNAPRARWQATQRLTYGLQMALLSFYITQKGMAIPFYFYDVFETSPQFHYDLSGTATTGRYIVRFNNPVIALPTDIGRADIQWELIEVS